MYRAFAIAFLLAFSLQACPASAKTGEPTICVLGSRPDGRKTCDSRSISVFAPNTGEVVAELHMDVSAKLKVEFAWYRPDGSLVSRTVKVAFPGRDKGGAAAWDGVTPEGSEGWWRVEAAFEGGFLSKRFLLTKNRQILTAVGGSEDAALRVIRKADPASGTGRDVLIVAAAGNDTKRRVAALSMMAGVYEDWAAQAVREGLIDDDALVRLSALGSADILPESERERAYLSAMASSDPEFRLAGAAGMGGLDTDGARGALMAALSDSEPGVRLAALSILAGRRAPGLDARLEALVADHDPGVAETALEAALALPDSDFRVRSLASAAMSARVDLARRAVDALLHVVTEDALPPLMKHFREGYRRTDVLRAMSSVGGAKAAGFLAEAYGLSKNDARLRLAAVSGLAGRGGVASEVLGEALGDPSAAVRLEAVKSINTLPDAADRTALLGTALADADPAVRKAALGGLANAGTQAAFEKVIEALDDASLGEDALERLAGSGLTPQLLEMLSERGHRLKDKRIRRRVVVMLSAFGLDASRLGEYLGDEDPDTRKAALDGLKGMGTQDSRTAAVDALGDPRLRDDALKYVESGLTPGLAVLLSEKGHGVPDAGFRRRVLDAAVKGGAGAKELGSYLDDPDPGVRDAALTALAEEGTAEAHALVMDRIGDPALGDAALEHIKKKGITPEMMRVLAEKGHAVGDAGFRGRVVSALSTGGAGGGELILGYLDDPDPDVGRTALRRIEAIMARDRDAGLREGLAAAGHSLRDTGLRLKVVGALADAGAGASELSGYLEDSSPEVGRAAVEALLRLGTPQSYGLVAASMKTPALRDAVLRGVKAGADPVLTELAAQNGHGIDDAGFRMRLVRVLAEAGLGADGLTGYLTDPDPDVRAEAIKGLSLLKGPDAAYGLFLAGREHGAMLRETAIRGLAKMGTEELEGGLMLILGRGMADKEVVGFAMEAVRDVRVRETLLDNIPVSDDSRTAAALLPLINDGNIASGALGLVRDGLSSSVLEMLADKGRLLEKAVSRERLVRTLAEKGIGSRGMIPYLGDPDVDVRAAAVEGLTALGGPGGAYGLFLAGKDYKERIRRDSEAGIGRLDGPALSAGLEMLFEKGEADREAVDFIARSVTDPAVLEALVKKIPADDTGRLDAALRPIMKRGGDSAVPALAEGLKAEEKGLRDAVIKTLCGIEGPVAGDALAKAYAERPGLRQRVLAEASAGVHAGDVIELALGDDDPGLRLKAASLIGQVADGRAQGLVAAALSDPDERVRTQAAVTAGKLGDLDGLALAAGDGASGVRTAAARGLSTLNGARAAGELGRLALDTDAAVSDTALHGLERMGGDVPDTVWEEIAGASEQSRAKLAALKALGKSPEAKHAALFAHALSDGNNDVGDAAEEGLKRLGRPALAAVHPLLEDKAVCERALDVVDEVRDRSSEGPLISVLPMLEGPSLKRAIGVLGELGGAESLEVFSKMYPGADVGMRAVILKAVSNLDLSGSEPGLVALLSEALASGDETVRFYGVRAAGEKRVSALKASLSAMLGSEGSALVRHEIERSLGEL